MTPAPEPRTVAIIGAGTIGRAVGERLAAGTVPGLRLLGYLVRPGGGTPVAGQPIFERVEDLLRERPTAVVESASHEAVAAYAEPVLESGAHLLCLSVGALADPSLRDRLAAAGRRGGARLIVPSGAVAGLDLLRAAAEEGLDGVEIEQRKPPRTLLQAEEADTLREALVVFEGSVAEVVRRYPRTTNVAAAVALAGLGFDATRARVVADPAIAGNQAILTARGSFGVLSMRLENVPSADPRTSAVVAPSVIAALRALDGPVVVPG